MHHIPNIISILRILLVIPVVLLLLEQRYGEALLLFFIAGVSDGVDGFLAKQFGWVSRLGSILDPLADKLLLVCSFLTLAWLGFIPLTLVVAVMLRDLLIVLGGVIYHYRVGRFDMQPSRISKANTFFQIVLVLAVVFYHGEFVDIPWVVEALVYIVWTTTLVSGADYVWTWGRRACRHAPSSAAACHDKKSTDE